jgi:tetratricopeptide (TPR) repeat protein
MTRRRRPSNPIRVVGLLILVAAAFYLNKVVVPTIQDPFSPTPTATRNPESYVTDAEQLFNAGKLTQSIATYKDAIRSQPGNPATHIALARVLVFAGQYAEAQKSAENALLLNPENSMAHAVRGWALYFEGDYPNAEAALKKALELDPNNAMAHAYYSELLGDMAFAQDYSLLDKATAESRAALELAPNTLESHRARGYILELTGNPEEAVQEYKAALTINNNIADVHLALGRVYRAVENYNDAISEFTMAYSFNPTDPLPNLYISRVYAAEGDYGKAIQYAEQSVTTAPADTRLRGNLGTLYFRNFKYDDAFRELSMVVHGGTTDDGTPIPPIDLIDDPRIAEYYTTFGLTLNRLGRCGEAIGVFQQVLSIVSPDQLSYTNAQEGLAACQENIGDDGSVTATEAPTVEPTPTP